MRLAVHFAHHLLPEHSAVLLLLTRTEAFLLATAQSLH